MHELSLDRQRFEALSPGQQMLSGWAYNAKTSSDLRWFLEFDPRGSAPGLLRNPNVTPRGLYQLALAVPEAASHPRVVAELGLREAANPEADPEWLSVLVRLYPRLVEPIVAENPGAPPELLRSLWKARDTIARQISCAYSRPKQCRDALEDYEAEDGTEEIELLRWLEKSHDDVIGKVARNPNTPPDLLKRLSRSAGFEAAVRENPAWPLLLLEDPGLAEREGES